MDIWAARFACLYSDESVEKAASAMASIILEEYDGAQNVKWNMLPGSDKDALRLAARRALRAVICHAQIKGSPPIESADNTTQPIETQPESNT